MWFSQGCCTVQLIQMQCLCCYELSLCPQLFLILAWKPEAQLALSKSATTLPTTCLLLISRSQGRDSHIHRITSQPWWNLRIQRKRRKRPKKNPARHGSQPMGSKWQVFIAALKETITSGCPLAPPQSKLRSVERSRGSGVVSIGTFLLTYCFQFRNGGKMPCLLTCWSPCWIERGGAGTSATGTLICIKSHHVSLSFPLLQHWTL